MEQYVYNIMFSDVGRKSANENNSTSGLRELWVVDEGVLNIRMRKMTGFYYMGVDFLAFIERICQATCFESIIEAKMVVGV